MQGAQASCNGGGSDPPTIPPSLSLPKVIPRPSFSLELYNRFADNNIPSSPSLTPLPDESHSPMDLDSEDIATGVPPPADDAITIASSPSTDACITTPSAHETMRVNKASTKRAITTDSPSTSLLKKPSPSSSSDKSSTRDSSCIDSASAVPPPPNTSSSLRYNNKDKPPFIVQVQSTLESSPPHPFHISRILSQALPREILEIRKLGPGRVLVYLNSYESANRLANNNSLTTSNLKAFIPSYRVLRSGIVRDIPQDVSLEMLKESISSPIRILEIHRLNRRFKNGNEIQYVPSRTICVKFAGQSLPRFIYLHNCRHSVSPFIPKTRICFSCFRVGHLSKSCKGRPRCLHCGDAQHPSAEVCPSSHSPAKCINCEGNHLATSHDCPRVLHHKTALSLAAVENISLGEALRLVGSSSSFTSGSPLSDPRFDFNNFPYLPRQRTSPTPDFDIPLSNRFTPIVNPLIPKDPPPRLTPKPYSMAAKNPTYPRYRFQLDLPHFNSTPGHSGPTNSAPRYSFPKEHRDLLLDPNGRIPSPTINYPYTVLPPPTQLSPQESNVPPTQSDIGLADIHRLLFNHSEMLRQLFDLLGGLSPPAYSATYDSSFPPLNSGSTTPSQTSQSLSSRFHGISTQP